MRGEACGFGFLTFHEKEEGMSAECENVRGRRTSGHSIRALVQAGGRGKGQPSGVNCHDRR